VIPTVDHSIASALTVARAGAVVSDSLKGMTQLTTVQRQRLRSRPTGAREGGLLERIVEPENAPLAPRRRAAARAGTVPFVGMFNLKP